MIKEANRRPPHATGTLFPSRNQYTPVDYSNMNTIFFDRSIEVKNKKYLIVSSLKFVCYRIYVK